MLLQTVIYLAAGLFCVGRGGSFVFDVLDCEDERSESSTSSILN